MTMDDYLTAHFVPKARLAELAELSLERLDELLAASAIPQASYVSDGHVITSAVFGSCSKHPARAGDFFRPEGVRWVRIALQAPIGEERAAVLAVLDRELRVALVAAGLTPEEVEAKLPDFTPPFLDGTFGLCTADPATGAGIARKETLQSRLTLLTADGTNPTPVGVSRAELLQLIDAYAHAAMPFSPADYARSSRKRLVDDLRPLVART